MKRIDIIGAPGVGKSFIFHNFFKKIRDDYIKPDYDIHIQRGKINSFHEGIYDTILFHIVNMVPDRRYVKKLSDKYNYIDLSLSIKNNKSKNIDKFIIGVLDLVEEYVLDQRKKLLVLHELNIVIRNYLYNDYYSVGKYVVFDESLLHKSLLILGDNSNSYKSLEKLFKILPLPSGVIYVYASEKNILKRINERNKKIISHIDFTKHDITTKIQDDNKFYKKLKERIEAENINILNINNDDKDIDINNKILKFIKSEV